MNDGVVQKKRTIDERLRSFKELSFFKQSIFLKNDKEYRLEITKKKFTDRTNFPKLKETIVFLND